VPISVAASLHGRQTWFAALRHVDLSAAELKFGGLRAERMPNMRKKPANRKLPHSNFIARSSHWLPPSRRIFKTPFFGDDEAF
jgi:hypothetical protein